MGFIDINPGTALKCLKGETNFSNDLLIVDAYSKTPKLYGMERITTEKVMYKLDMFQDGFGKIYKFDWWYLKIFSADVGI